MDPQRVWEIYDALPAPIRAELQEGPVNLYPPAFRKMLNKQQRKQVGVANAVADVVADIRETHAFFIESGAEFWLLTDAKRDLARQRREGWTVPALSPHMLANATMQTSGRR
jgi:hypothetical protein